ncbi:metacaspase-1-like isoform X2 [Euphorbia lathyris]|uniref:metacaspase-1-like isoform X2 n=1 Tax=Euphorbia lathyris TaxID=212925 RepID=UPI003313F319
MTSKRERCGWCSVQLLVPIEAQTVRCAVCQGVTRFQSYDTLTQVRDSINQAANRIINKVSTTVTGYTAAAPVGGYGYNGYYVKPPRQMGVPSAHGRKRAVLCGVSYKGTSYKIKGSINDVNCMRFFLVEKLGFPMDCILMLTDEISPLKIPTKENMRTAMRWLVEGCEAGDSLVFHFSGHGSKVPDNDTDKMDGYDEALCPLDYETQGMIIDDEINQTIVRPLPKGATLHAIVDACYSGSILHLPFPCKMNREGYYTWDEKICPSDIYKGTSGGLALCFSACNDDQISLDTNALAGNAATGALTYSLIQAVENEPGLTYGRLLNAMRLAIRSAKTSGLRLSGPIASLINKTLFNTELSQEPQLSSSEKFDIYSKHFLL